MKPGKYQHLIFGIVLLTLLTLVSCDKSSGPKGAMSHNDSLKAAKEDSIEIVKELAKVEEFPLIKYKQVIIKDQAHLKQIRQEYNHPKEKYAHWKTIMTLNRKEWRFIRVGQRIVIPDTIVEDLKAYSMFPQFYPGARDLNKLIVLSNKYQCYGAYEYGHLVRFAAVNSGKEKTPTYPGRYAFVWKERVRRSSLDSTWIMPFTYNFHGEAGNAFHQFEMPGYPASHSCVRQFMEDAEWVFNWAEGQKNDAKGKRIYMSGTPVLILDIYDFALGHKGPWLDLKSNKEVTIKLPEKPMEFEEALIPMCQIPVSSRGRLVNRKRFETAEKVLRERGVIRPNVVLTPTVNFNYKRRLEEEAKLKKQQEAQIKAPSDADKKNSDDKPKENPTNPETKSKNNDKKPGGELFVE